MGPTLHAEVASYEAKISWDSKFLGIGDVEETTPEGILEFTRKYGLLDPTAKFRFWPHVGKGNFTFKVRMWSEFQKDFQEHWDWNESRNDWETVKHDMWTELSEEVENRREFRHPGIELDYLVSIGRTPFIVLRAQSLWQYLCTLLMFHEVGDLRRCKNPDCPAPRFIALRKNQFYCSSDCAGLIAKRRWWAAHGEKWRKTQQRKRKSEAK